MKFIIPLIILFLVTKTFAVPLIVSGHPNYPPIIWEKNSKIVGVHADIIKAALDELKVKYVNKSVGPWKKVQEMARTGMLDVIIGIYMNEDRKSYLEFSTPIMEDHTSIFTLKDKAFKFEKWSDLKNKKGTYLFGESFGEKFDTYMKKELRVSKSYSINEIFQKLKNKKVDYCIWGYYPGLIYSIERGFNNEIVPLKNPLTSENSYIAFAKQSDLTFLMKKINTIILRMKENGEIEKLIEKHLASLKK